MLLFLSFFFLDNKNNVDSTQVATVYRSRRLFTRQCIRNGADDGKFHHFFIVKEFRILPKISFYLLLCKVTFYQDGI
jgi:hypothetical protein